MLLIRGISLIRRYFSNIYSVSNEMYEGLNADLMLRLYTVVFTVTREANRLHLSQFF